MILDTYQFKELKAIMSERLIEASKQDHTIHGYMVYQCEHCNNVYVMWLEKGLEDPTDDKKTGMHKPVPFGFTCPACGGMTTHVLWPLGMDSLGKNYKSYQKYVDQPNKLIYRNFFWNDPKTDYGVPIIFEPDYCWERKIGYTYYMAEIYINTLPDDSVALIDDEPIELLDLKGNRERRRHGLIGKDGYKRPKSNKKLYEY